MLIKYTKSVLWRAVKRLSYKQDARCLKVKQRNITTATLETPQFACFRVSRHSHLIRLCCVTPSPPGGSHVVPYIRQCTPLLLERSGLRRSAARLLPQNHEFDSKPVRILQFSPISIITTMLPLPPTLYLSNFEHR